MRNASILAILTCAACANAQPAPDAVPEALPVERAYSSRAVSYDAAGYPAGRLLQRYADLVLIDKSDRILVVYSGGKAIRAYRGIQFGDAPMGHKRFQGDERTPEGRYFIDRRNPQSSYYLSLGISYPNSSDRAFAESYGRSPGGDIFIHGQPNGLASDRRMRGDWTDGCIALANHEIAELWSLVPDGTPIIIRR